MGLRETKTMTRGPDPKLTTRDIYEVLHTGMRPVWTVSMLSEEFETSRPTIQKQLDGIADEYEDVSTLKVGRSTAHFVPGVTPGELQDVDTEQHHRKSLEIAYKDKFVGLPTAPWTATHPHDGPTQAGDRVQLRVEGTPGDWTSTITRDWDDRREDLDPDELSPIETQALISGELYSKPTVPIEHSGYPGDFDLEGKTGADTRRVGDHSREVLVATGIKNHLLKPCNDAVFLKDVTVDWISPKGEPADLEEEFSTEDLDLGPA